MLTNRSGYKRDNLRDVQKVFNNGVCEVFSAQEREITESKGKFAFAYESVGISHFYQAYNNNVVVDSSISIPKNSITVNVQDVVLINDEWYRIVRIQFHDNMRPNYYTLSLSKSMFNYILPEPEENGGDGDVE